MTTNGHEEQKEHGLRYNGCPEAGGGRRWPNVPQRRDSVLQCGGPPPLFGQSGAGPAHKSARALAQSTTLSRWQSPFQSYPSEDSSL